MAEKYVPPAAVRATKYDFSDAKPGESNWYSTNTQRTNALAAFKTWKSRTNAPLNAFTVQVGSEDPRGPGYRLVFERGEVDIKPAIKSSIEMYDRVGTDMRWIFNRTGIFSNDDIMAALADEGDIPTTLGHAKAFKQKLVEGKTRYQVEYCRAAGLPTLEEGARAHARAQRDEDDARREKALAKPQARRDPPPAGMWSSLLGPDRAAMRAVGIADEETFTEAWRTFPPDATNDAVLFALREGYGAWHAYRIRLAVMNGHAATEIEGGEE